MIERSLFLPFFFLFSSSNFCTSFYGLNVVCAIEKLLFYFRKMMANNASNGTQWLGQSVPIYHSIYFIPDDNKNACDARRFQWGLYCIFCTTARMKWISRYFNRSAHQLDKCCESRQNWHEHIGVGIGI